MNSTARIPVIDFLRGLSCLGVLLYHVRVELWIGWWRITSYPQEYSSFAKSIAWLSLPAPFLGYAVLLFFLISGFCIHFPNTGAATKPCWKTYFVRRFWRIYPTFLVALGVTTLISLLLNLYWGDKTWDSGRFFRVATLTQNYPPSNGQFLTNPSLWTIPLEVEFYLLYPFAFCLFSRLKSFLLWFFALALSILSIYLSFHGLTWLTFTSLFLWPSWLIGAWVAQLYRNSKLVGFKIHYQLLTLTASLVCAVASRYENWDSWAQYCTWTAFYLFFFIFCLSRTGLLLRLIGNRIFEVVSWIGKISFSLYLIHFPLFKFFGYFHVELFGGKPTNFLVTLLYLIPVILSAWLFFKLVENPLHLRSKQKLGIN